MPTRNTSLRTLKRERTIADIIHAAVELFERHGYDETTVAEIAEYAGYSQSTLFRYFGSKEDIVFLDLPERIHGELFPTDSTVPVWAAVKETITAQVMHFAGATDDVARCAALWFAEPSLERRFRELYAMGEAKLAKFLRAHSHSKSTDLAAEVAASAVTGLAIAAARLQVDGPEAVAAALEEGFELLEGGLLVAFSLDASERSSGRQGACDWPP